MKCMLDGKGEGCHKVIYWLYRYLCRFEEKEKIKKIKKNLFIITISVTKYYYLLTLLSFQICSCDSYFSYKKISL